MPCSNQDMGLPMNNRAVERLAVLDGVLIAIGYCPAEEAPIYW